MLPLPDTSFPAESGRTGNADVSQVGLDLSHILVNGCQRQVKDVKFHTNLQQMKGKGARQPSASPRGQTHSLLGRETHHQVAEQKAEQSLGLGVRTQGTAREC